MLYFGIYLILMNLLGFFSMGWDKRKAKKHLYRTPEKVLLFIAFLGGSFGSYLGMRIFHHKTRHPLFYIGVPVLLFAHIAIVIFFILHPA